MAHARTQSSFQAAVQVAQRLGHGLGQLGAHGNQRCQGGGQSIARAHKGRFQPLKFFAAHERAGAAQGVINKLFG